MTTLMKLILWAAIKKGGGSQGQFVTVTGSSPLALVNSLAHAIKSLTQFGKCVQNGTPTPDAPVDILCNNGALRYGKPLTLDPTRISAYINENGYWLYSSDSYSIAVPVEVGTKVAIRFTTTDSSEVSTIYRYGFRDSATPDWSSSPTTPLSQVYRGSPQAKEYVELTADRPYLIIQLSSSRAAHILSSGYLVVSKQEIYTDGTDEVLTVSGKNLFDPTKVLLGYYRDFSTGNKRASFANFMSSDDGYIPCLPDTAYTFVGTNKTDGTYSMYNSIYFFDSAKNYLGVSRYQISQPTTGTTPSNCRYLQVRSNPLDTISVSIQEAFQRFNWQLELGSIVTDYEPYHAQTVSVPMLLGVGDYKDEVELIQGIKTGKVGIKVFDGTETFDKSSAYGSAFYIRNATVGWGAQRALVMCSHYLGLAVTDSPAEVDTCFFNTSGHFYFRVNDNSDTAAFKSGLAAQYAAGTPVIVLYPLATETTEQTTPHALHSYNGTTIVDAQTNVDPVELACEYYASQAPNLLFGGFGNPNADEPSGDNPSGEEES